MENLENAIEVTRLTKHFGTVKAIDSVSFNVAKGQIVGFLGPNGAGKSTTMRILCGLTSATSGLAKICGIPVASHPSEVKRLVGYLPERNPLPEDMRVLEYLRYRARLKEIPRNKLKATVDAVMDTCDLNRKARKRVIATLSKGYRQRIGIADAILGKPKVIIMDEPTIGLDPHQILGIRRLIDGLRNKMTVLLSSHILPEIEMCCDRVIIINQGRIVAHGTSSSLREEFLPKTKYRLSVHGPLDTFKAIINDVDPSIELTDDSPPCDDGYRELHIEAPSLNQITEPLIKALTAHDFGIKEIARIEPNLEDIFMAATKRSWDETYNPRPTVNSKSNAL